MPRTRRRIDLLESNYGYLDKRVDKTIDKFYRLEDELKMLAEILGYERKSIEPGIQYVKKVKT